MNPMQRELSSMGDTIKNINDEGQEDYQHLSEGLGLEEETQEQVPSTEVPLEEEAEEEKGEEVPKKKTRDNRIKEITYERNLLRDEVNRLAQKNHHTEQLLHQQSQVMQEKERRAFQSEENNLKGQITSAQKEWQRAFDDGNSEQLAEAATKLSYYTSQLVTTKKHQETYNQYQTPAYPPPPAREQYVEPDYNQSTPNYSSQINDWVDQNSWYDTSSDDFDPHLRKAVDQYADEYLNTYYSPEDPRYVQKLNEFVRKQFDNATTSYSKQPLMKKSSQMVAPVNRGPVNGGMKPNPIDKVLSELTPGQKQTALSLIYNDPRINDNPQMKLKKYAEGILLDRKRQAEEKKAGFNGGFYL